MVVERLLLLLFVALFASAARAGLDIQHWTTPEGARVYFVENHDLPMLDISVDFAAGSAYDTAARSGLASLTRQLLPLGAGAWSESEITERLADVGAQLGGTFDEDRAGFTLRTLSSAGERDASVAVLRAILAEPHFPAEVLEREQQRVIAGLREAATKPDYIAQRALQRAVFGDHPYALPEAGEPDTVAALGVEALREFHARHYRAANMSIALMGDLDRAQAERIAASLAVALPAGEPPPPPPPVTEPGAGGEQRIPHHATQSHLLLGLPGMTRADPDYFPLLVGNYVLGGGGFDSRLTEEIRQKRGLAYSVYSFLAPQRRKGIFQIGLQTRRETTDQALQVVRETLRRFLEEGPSADELVQAKGNMAGGFPLRLDSNRKILGYLSVIGFYGLPLDWLDRYVPQVEAVTAADVLRAFRARVAPEAMSTVVVGGQIEAAGGGR